MDQSSSQNSRNSTYPEKDRRKAPRTRPNPMRLAVFPALFICMIMFQNMGRLVVSRDTSSLLGHALVEECLGSSLGRVKQLKKSNLSLLAAAHTQWAADQISLGQSSQQICNDLVAQLNSPLKSK